MTHLFTKATAREFGMKGNAIRWGAGNRENIAEMKDSPVKATIAEARSPETYIDSRLTRVRKQLDKVDEMMLRERDPSKLDRLASASARLAEQERQLSNRPMPGSLKPSSRPSRSSRSPLTQPEPVAEAQAAPGPEPGPISEDWKQFTG